MPPDNALMEHLRSSGQGQSIEDKRAQGWNNIKNAPGRLAQGIFTGLAGAPVEIANSLLRPVGLGSDNPVGGMNHLASLINADTSSVPYNVGTVLPISPEQLGIGGLALAGIFAGKGAKTADVARLGLAEEMFKKGIPDEVIHAKTGWFKGMADGKWRFEIPDNAAKYDAEVLLELKANPKFNYKADTQPMGGVLSHKDLYSAYPETSDIPVHFMPKQNMQEAFGAYSNKLDRITLGDVAGDQTSPALHELQHAIQQREGFARGGSPESLRQLVKIDNMMQGKPAPTDADVYSAYQRLAGEAEARLTQARMNMNAKQRAKSYPPAMMDVPVSEQIVRYGDTGAQPWNIKP